MPSAFLSFRTLPRAALAGVVTAFVSFAPSCGNTVGIGPGSTLTNAGGAGGAGAGDAGTAGGAGAGVPEGSSSTEDGGTSDADARESSDD